MGEDGVGRISPRGRPPQAARLDARKASASRPPASQSHKTRPIPAQADALPQADAARLVYIHKAHKADAFPDPHTSRRGLYPQGKAADAAQAADTLRPDISTRQGTQAAADRLSWYDHKPPQAVQIPAQAARLDAPINRYDHKPRKRPATLRRCTDTRIQAAAYIRSHKPPPKVFYIKSTFYYSYLL